jgi:hypothetical protein
MEITVNQLPEYITRRLVKPWVDCWIWSGATEKGYGRVVIDDKRVRVHRHVYELLIGPVPEGLELDHLCRVRACFNPAHLEPVTSQENLRRSAPWRVRSSTQRRKRRIKNPPKPRVIRTHCSRGHEFTPENTYMASDGWRRCLICHKAADRKRWQRDKDK